ncbi:MAG: helix-turn-helix domain-containing protein [Lachnospiraceae bacterium]|nr:helix-turn-helix domain-containing protein [Lachnospiraceae bacterium]
MDIDVRLALFRDMIGCCHNLYLWVYDSAFHPITSNCPEQPAVNDLFGMSHRQEDFDRQITAYHTPVIFTNELGLMWVMMPHFASGELIRFYVLGPFFIDDIPPQNIKSQLNKYGLSILLRQEFLHFLRKLPIISLNRIFEYAIMLHFCVTGEKITVSDLRYYENKQQPPEPYIQWGEMDAHGSYEGEQEMLRMVRNGDLNYQTQMDKMAITGRLGKLSNGDSLRQMKNAVLVCITLFSRAAIEGGLTPEVSYTLTDHYFQSVEACSAITDLVEISHTMQADFIRRVHQCRTSSLSRPIQDCCEYINLHLEDKLTLATLAHQTGYTENYLSKKFKRELNLTPIEYIRKERLERAAFLLRTTQSDVQDISDRLQFCSQSYFADNFRKLFGCSPTKYRQQKN